jgi:hypothetical protein
VADYTPKTYVDYLVSFEAGMNSGVSPQILSRNQLAFALNISLRGTFAKTRPPIQRKTLAFADPTLATLFQSGLFQGAGYYRPDYGTESLIAQIDGHLLQFLESGSVWNVTDISIRGDLNSATVSQVWMWQSEKWMIIQDGTGKLPIFFDGTTSRRSYGPTTLLGTVNGVPAPTTPPAIGGVVVVTLTTNYTGPMNVPVIFNKEFYQTAPANGNNIILTNITDTPGTVYPSGTAVTLNPNMSRIGHTGIGGGSPGFVVLYLESSISSSGGFTLGLSDRPNLYSGITTTDPLQIEVLGQNAFGPNGALPPDGTIAINASNTNPGFQIGLTANNFTVPATGATTVVAINQPFVGLNQIVQIGTGLYSVSPAPSTQSPLSLTLINLTDTSSVAYAAGLTIVSVPELPAGRMGAYGMGCNAVCLTDALSYIISDVVGAPSGTPANNYRDAVLKMTQNTFLSGGGNFRLPGSGDTITAMFFPPTLDTSLGQGPLQIGTAFSCFSNYVVGTYPGTWASLTNPIQTESLKDKGPLAQDSTIFVNSDTFFRSSDGISSLIMARRDFFNNSWGNKSVANEIQRILSPDNQTLLSYGSAMSFDNRYFSTLSPQVSARGVFHMGLGVLNNDLISSLRTTLPAAWEGAWTGVNALKVLTGRINGYKRAMAFTFNIDANTIELYEFLPETTTEYLDNGVTPIVSVFETAALFNKDIKPLDTLVQLRDGEVYLSDIKGDVKVTVYYKPDFYPCWTLWHEFEVCQKNDANNSKPGYRTRIGLGEPDVTVLEPGNNRPMREGYTFQFRFEITGHVAINGMRVAANSKPQTVFAPIAVDPAQCVATDCDIQDDFRIYSVQGLPPAPLVPVVSPPLVASNAVVYYPYPCGAGTTLIYRGVLPTWITLDSVTQQLIGAANTFWGGTQSDADSQAQTALNSFATAAITAGTLVCFSCTGLPTTLAGLVWTFTNSGGVRFAGSGASPTIVEDWFSNSAYLVAMTGYAQATFCNPTAAAINIKAETPTWGGGVDGVTASYIGLKLNGQVILYQATAGTTPPAGYSANVNHAVTIAVPAYSSITLQFQGDHLYDAYLCINGGPRLTPNPIVLSIV